MGGFWLELLDGPCKGVYTTQHAPDVLVAVRKPVSGDCDVLDAPGDTKADDEVVYAYVRARDAIVPPPAQIDVGLRDGTVIFVRPGGRYDVRCYLQVVPHRCP